MLKSTFEADMKSSKSSNFCLTLGMLGKIAADNSLKYFFYFSKKIRL